MSISKSKNLERKLNNIAQEATNELNNVCGSSLWENLGFMFFDQLEDPEKIAKANFYYGQLQIINEFNGAIQGIEIDIDKDQEIAKQAGINGTPTVQLFKNKLLKKQWQGVKQRSEFKEAIQNII